MQTGAPLLEFRVPWFWAESDQVQFAQGSEVLMPWQGAVLGEPWGRHDGPQPWPHGSVTWQCLDQGSAPDNWVSISGGLGLGYSWFAKGFQQTGWRSSSLETHP